MPRCAGASGGPEGRECLRLESLSPRLRQTLAHLLEGDSEKEVAAQLGLSVPTTHQYVTTLYRHFGVRSRSQLIAHLLQRLVPGLWNELLENLVPDDSPRFQPLRATLIDR